MIYLVSFVESGVTSVGWGSGGHSGHKDGLILVGPTLDIEAVLSTRISTYSNHHYALVRVLARVTLQKIKELTIIHLVIVRYEVMCIKLQKFHLY